MEFPSLPLVMMVIIVIYEGLRKETSWRPVSLVVFDKLEPLRHEVAPNPRLSYK